MNILITASVGLYVYGISYYLQVIISDTDESYLISIDEHTAKVLSEKENLEISPLPD